MKTKPELPAPAWVHKVRTDGAWGTTNVYAADQLEQYAKDYAAWVMGEPVAWLVDYPNDPILGSFFATEPVDSSLGFCRSNPLYALKEALK
jgi:hypothetical protein